MSYDNSGVLFRNDYAKTDKHPAYKGKLTVEGKEYSLAAWVNEKNGRKYLSLKVSEPYKKDSDHTQVAEFEKDTDIPF